MTVDPIALAEAYIEQIETLRLRNTIASHTWVVLSGHNIPLTFEFQDLGNGTKSATSATPCPLKNAPQFTKNDAETLASFVIDGTGKRGVAMFINDAIDLHQLQQREAIAIMATPRQAAPLALPKPRVR